MKIRSVSVNNRKKSFEIETSKGELSLPFAKAGLVPSADNPVADAYVDKELGSEGITYVLASGDENSLHLDAFLEYNRDPEYVAKILLHTLTVKALELLKRSKLTKRELARRLATSPTGLHRLVNPEEQSKTLDQMVKLLSVLGYEVEIKISERKGKAA